MGKNIVLIGMPGSGKTRIGRALARRLNMRFHDLDRYIEIRENKSIKEMFEISEEYFREMETKYSILLSKLNSHVIATGGGAVTRKQNMVHLKKNSIVVFINRPIENIVNNIKIKKRPLLAEGKEKLYQLYDERINLYKFYCDIEVLNTGSVDATINDIVNKIKLYRTTY